MARPTLVTWVPLLSLKAPSQSLGYEMLIQRSFTATKTVQIQISRNEIRFQKLKAIQFA